MADYTIGMVSFKEKSSSPVFSRRAVSGTRASIYISWVLKAILSYLMVSLERDGVAATAAVSSRQVVHLESGMSHLVAWATLVLYSIREPQVASKKAWLSSNNWKQLLEPSLLPRSSLPIGRSPSRSLSSLPL